MASDVNLAADESVKVNAPAGGSLKTTTSPSSITVTGVAALPAPTPEPTPDPVPTPTPGAGVLISPADLAKLPTSGKAWDAVKSHAGKTISPSLSDQNSPANVDTLAAALVAARTNDSAARSKVIGVLKKMPSLQTGRALALGRELGAYALSADLVKATDAEVGYNQKAWYKEIVRRDIHPSDGPASLIACARQRPNNWGTHAFGSLACVAYYTGDTALQDELYKIFLGWLGDRSQYAGFTYGDKSWQADSTKPVGINPVGATKSGHNIDGVLPDDQRRAGGFSWPPPDENYVWEALQGATLAALVFEHQGKPIFAKSGHALLRAVRWMYVINGFPAGGDDSSTPWVYNRFEAAHLPTTLPSTPGKNFGYTDWLYG